jgi:hypothetical protein
MIYVRFWSQRYKKNSHSVNTLSRMLNISVEEKYHIARRYMFALQRMCVLQQKIRLDLSDLLFLLERRQLH